VVLATRRAQKDAGDVIAVPSVIKAARRAQMDQETGCHGGTGEAWRVSAVPPEDGVTETMTMNHDAALAVFLRLMTTSQLMSM
jgi:hypothetical protein